MPYPVPPPEPPPIVKHLPPEKFAHAADVSVGTLNRELISSQATHTTGETSNSSPLGMAKSAALLGEPQSLAVSEEQENVGDWEIGRIGEWETRKTGETRETRRTREISLLPTTHYPLPTTQSPVPSPQSQVPEEPQILPEGHIAPSDSVESRPETEIQPSAEKPPPPATTTPENFPALVGIIEVFSDRQEFDTLRQIFTAEGNVLVRFQGGVLDADRVQGNLVTRTTVAEGNVAFRRGGQLLRGERLVYNFVQDSGTVQNARGEIFLPSSGTDLTFGLATGSQSPALVADRPLSDRLLEDQPLQQVIGAGGFTYSVGGGRANINLPAVRTGSVGQINRVRFEAQNIDFYPRGWTARNIRITNDPFSPPELEIRADRAVLTQVSPLRDEVQTTRPRLVFDQGLAVPIFPSRYVFDRSDREPPIARLGYDADERGGVFIEAPVTAFRNERVRLQLTPQFFLERSIREGFGNPARLFGLRTRFNATISDRTTARASVVINNFDFLDNGDEKVRASLRLDQIIGTSLPHRLSLEYSYRDRLYNGSLGYQTVRQSYGALLTSPFIRLGNTGINLTYQFGAQFINADTDRLDLLDPVRENNRVDLGRFQASVTASRGFFLWRGKPLPATATEGLRYTPYPVIPFVQILPVVTGTTSAYTSGDSQSSLTFSLGLQAQFGHFSRPFLDYTGFNIVYTQVLLNGLSPFFFDRVADQRVLSFGVTQQVYGPIRIGFQSSINLDTNESISTDYFLEYSRRTYGVTLRYNPDLQLGAIIFRVSDFNWNAGAEPFRGSGVRFIDTGVTRETD